MREDLGGSPSSEHLLPFDVNELVHTPYTHASMHFILSSRTGEESIVPPPPPHVSSRTYVIQGYDAITTPATALFLPRQADDLRRGGTKKRCMCVCVHVTNITRVYVCARASVNHKRETENKVTLNRHIYVCIYVYYNASLLPKIYAL